jgi:hypothetical protein
MPQGQPPAVSLRLARLTWHETNVMGLTFVTRGGNLLTMNGSPNLRTVDKGSSGLNAAIIWAGAMAAMDTVAVAVAAVAVAVAAVAAVEAGIIMEAVEAKAKIMGGVLMRPRRVTVSRHLRRVQKGASL